MSDLQIQASFNGGEWSQKLFARVDLQKYRSGAALLRNFFVDYRGGATTRPGTKYILQTKSTSTVRLIPFQASFTVSYILEFGQNYIRFFSNGAPVLETAIAITAATNANPGVFTHVAHGYSTGDWVEASTFSGGTWGTNLNGNFYIVVKINNDTFSLTDLFGNAINTTGFGTFSAGNTSRVYTLLTSPYLDHEVFGIRYAQNVNQLILCHPNYPPYVLTLNSATNWTLAAITFGSTVTAPTGQAVATTLSAGSVNYAYVITAVDVAGQESAPSAFATLASKTDIRTTAGTNTVTWNSVTGAVSYNVYRAEPSYAGAVPGGATFGFVGSVTGTSFIDSNIGPDFSVGPPIVQNPFFGSGIATITVNTVGSYTTFPAITFTGGGSGSGAAATPVMGCITVTLVYAGLGYHLDDILTIVGDTSGAKFVVTSVDGAGRIVTIIVGTSGNLGSAPLPSTNAALIPPPGGGGAQAVVNTTWFLQSIGVTSPGSGYSPAPSVVISGSGGGAATATLGAASSGNPTVPNFIQQRMFLGGPVSSPAQFNMSQPGAEFNFNITAPIAADNAIQGTLVSGQLNTIQSVISMPAGMITLTDKGAWLINGGSPGSAITATSVVANQQAYNGASALPPIVANSDILYVQAKGSIVRNLTYNFYANIYTGTDISVFSAHLFYGFTISQWAWAEEPFKVVHAVRNDGTLLHLTFQKEQEMIAWTHSDTLGTFQSVATVTEQVSFGSIDAVYVIAQRSIQGQTLNYVERFTELFYPADYKSSWQVDAGIGYNGVAATTFSGAQHLGGQVVTGLADGVVINFTMPTNGTFIFGPGGTTGLTGIANASIVTVGLGFTAQIQTLPIDLGEPTIQGKVKKIPEVTVRVAQTLGLKIGPDFNNLVPMKDLVIGAVGSMLTGQASQTVTGLFSGDARSWITSAYTVPGQYCIQQDQPFPASVLGVIPAITVGDSPVDRGR